MLKLALLGGLSVVGLKDLAATGGVNGSLDSDRVVHDLGERPFIAGPRALDAPTTADHRRHRTTA
ncbi:MAG: hypothetical protein KBB95_25490 [Deltaproteobacteria bacterium]|nr:hypothetical protein [Deltaproteobacteria bacterium]